MKFNISFKYHGNSDDAYSLRAWLSKTLGVYVDIQLLEAKE